MTPSRDQLEQDKDEKLREVMEAQLQLDAKLEEVELFRRRKSLAEAEYAAALAAFHAVDEITP